MDGRRRMVDGGWWTANGRRRMVALYYQFPTTLIANQQKNLENRQPPDIVVALGDSKAHFSLHIWTKKVDVLNSLP